ncbi:MAG: hypothetical protein EBS54_10715, partial [Betaproteobacteria bacterium]|nr:hypothetical protein [Betaproteobacteria bacterium]
MAVFRSSNDPTKSLDICKAIPYTASQSRIPRDVQAQLRHHSIQSTKGQSIMSMRGFIFYRGKSPIDAAPIVGIAVLRSKNVKTGDMVQTYILRADVHPVDAIKSADDVSICGDCVHRGDDKRKRTCYVDVGKSVSAIYKAFKRGIYPDMSRNLSHAAAQLKGRKVRLGAYGDPAMIPADIWLNLLSQALDWTGYTHQWQQAFAQAHRELCMASADSIEDRDIARSMGWRTFRVIAINAAP